MRCWLSTISVIFSKTWTSPPTFQCYPTANVTPGEQTITEAIDLIMANRYARAIAASVPQCYGGDIAPSDHWPVQAIYQLISVSQP